MQYGYEALQLVQQGSTRSGRATIKATKKEITRASGLARSTAAAPQTIDAAAADDSSELTQWMSILDKQQEDVAEISSLPALQGLLEGMESQAGRLVSIELLAV